jgi:hypothetical protein
MKIDFAKFNGSLPYASEIYGIYQPLIGWKSRLTQQRASMPIQIPSYPREIDLISERHGGDPDFDDYAQQIIAAADRDPFEKNPNAVRFTPATEIDSLILRSVQDDLVINRLQHLPEEKDFWHPFLRDLFSPAMLQSLYQRAINYFWDWMREIRRRREPNPDPMNNYIRRVNTLLNGENPANLEAFSEYVLNKEIFVARYLDELVKTDLERLSKMVLGAMQIPSITSLLRSLDPAYLSPLAGREAVFSPIGILHLYRQYFFEFDTFLGPPVEHIWLSPGSTTELYEVSTRRVLIEKNFEQFSESIFRSEIATTDEDELSRALKEENLNDTKMGSSIEAGVNLLIVSIEASGDISNQQTQKVAREENHRRMRQQSAKLSSEIRSNFKSVFKTVTEVTDTRSKRYVIANDTGKLVNYELRRKMRQVGVQVQDSGTQLCWQVYVDEPGNNLGVAELVHLASKADLSQYPTLPTFPEPQPIVQVMNISLVVPAAGKRSGLTASVASGAVGFVAAGAPGAVVAVGTLEIIKDLFGDSKPESNIYSLGHGNKIIQSYKVNLPSGYQLAPASKQREGKDSDEFLLRSKEYEQDPLPEGDLPIRWLRANGKMLNWRAKLLTQAEGTLEFVVDRGDVSVGEVIEFQARIVLEPTAAHLENIKNANAANIEKNKEHEIERTYAIKKEFIKNVQERIKMASEIRGRKTEELREEERTVIYRSLISKLMRDAWSTSTDTESRKLAHVRSELLKSIFEIDRMLYFVAPEWWQPRLHTSQDLGASLPESFSSMLNKASVAALQKESWLKKLFQSAQISASRGGKLGTLEADDTVSWGGEGRKDNYLITSDSAPARLGSSLGWLLQLDGDNLRNAFLNAPWVKAVIPIRPGKEREALEWLMLSQVEGTVGLDETYAGSEPELQGLTNKEALFKLVDETHAKWQKSREVVTENIPNQDGEGDRSVTYLPSERLFEHGFDPLATGFRADPLNEFEVTDFWVEILPTDQVVATEVKYDPKTGMQIPVEE